MWNLLEEAVPLGNAAPIINWARIQPEDNTTLQKANESERTGLFDILALILSLFIARESYESSYLIYANS